jgi:NADP-dependent 3-hydroxy acid dehydrogenase YdfG
MNPFSLDGKIAMVTGASRGIGFGAARALCESGASVILVARQAGELAKAAAELRKEPPHVRISAFDLQNTAGIAAGLQSARTALASLTYS